MFTGIYIFIDVDSATMIDNAYVHLAIGINFEGYPVTRRKHLVRSDLTSPQSYSCQEGVSLTSSTSLPNTKTYRTG